MERLENASISLGKRQLVDSIWKSAGIEGLGTTFPHTEAILENFPVQTTKEEVLFVVNLKRGWEFLFNTLGVPVDLRYLRELNKICMEGLSWDAGNFRTMHVSIGGTSWKPEMPQKVVVMQTLSEITSQEDPLQVALDLFCYVAKAQLFLDGNKRLAQLVCNKVLMENDLGILSIPYDEILPFKELLVSYYETNQKEQLQKFFVEKAILTRDDKGRNFGTGQRNEAKVEDEIAEKKAKKDVVYVEEASENATLKKPKSR